MALHADIAKFKQIGFYVADFVSPQKRRKIMQGVKSKDTKPEMLVRRAVHGRGYRYRLHPKHLPGKPDLVLSRHKLAIMVHGCFWHQHEGCKDGRMPTSRPEFWVPKLTRNVERDAEKQAALEAAGYRVETIWECEAKDPIVLARRLDGFLPERT